MAKGTKFTYTTAEGKVETRTSARTYTHVVADEGELDYETLVRWVPRSIYRLSRD